MTMKRNRQFAAKRATALAICLLAMHQCAATAMAAVEVTVQSIEATAGGEAEVPINIRGATGLEGFQFVLTFDPQALEVIDVAAGPVAGAAEINRKEREPGKVRVAMLPESALDRGEGTLLVARFRILCQAGQELQVGIEEARASEFRASFPVWMQVVTTPGILRTTAGGMTVTVTNQGRWMMMGGAAFVLLLLVLLMVKRSSSRRRETA